MATYSLPYFGEIDTTALDEYYDATFILDGREVDIDLNFSNNSIDTEQLKVIERFIEQIPAFDKQNKVTIEQDYTDQDQDTARTYVDHHLEDMEEAELAEVINIEDTSISRPEQLLKALQLVRVGLYPNDEDDFAIFDYSIGREVTQYLVVLGTDRNGELSYITMES